MDQIIKNKRELNVGYYLQAPFARVNGKIMVPFDVARWSKEFAKHCNRFVCLMNSKEGTLEKNNSYYELNDKAELVNIGEIKPHYHRVFGMGFDRKIVYNTSKDLDVVIIQGPTPLMHHLANSLHPSCTPVFLLVGLWVKLPKEAFRPHSFLRELFINLLKWKNKHDTRRALGKGIVLGNNPIMKSFYNITNKFNLVSKGLVANNEIRHRKDASFNTPVQLLFYSRLDPDKHVETILRACANLKDRELSFHLTLAGGTNLESYFQYLNKLLISYGLDGDVTFLGHVPFHIKNKVFESSDIFIFNTCSTEGFPRAIWEAFSFGLPTICANYPGADRFFDDQINVMLFPLLDSKALANHIVKLITDRKFRNQLVSNQYKLLKSNTQERSVEHIVNLLKKELA